MKKLSFYEFVQLPDDEQDRRFKDAGFRTVDDIKGNGKDPVKNRHFLGPMDLTDGGDRLYVRKDLLIQALSVEFYRQGEPGLSFEYIVRDGKWTIDFDNIMADLSRILCPDFGVYCMYDDYYRIWNLFTVTIPDCQGMYERFIAEGKTIFDFVRKRDVVRHAIYNVAESPDLQDAYSRMKEIYLSYAKRATFISMPDIDRNPGLMTPARLVAFLAAVRVNDPDAVISPETVMCAYYVLHTGQLDLSDDTRAAYKAAMSPAALTDPDILRNFRVDALEEICRMYRESLPRYPFSDYIALFDKDFDIMSRKLHGELQDKYGLPDEVFDRSTDIWNEVC